MSGSLPKMTLVIILIIALSVVITTVSFTVFYSMVARPPEGEPTSGPDASVHLETAVVLEYDLGVITTNLADKKFIQLNIVLLYPEIKQKIWFGLREEVDEALPNALVAHDKQIRDVINTLLRDQRSTDLSGDRLSRFKDTMISRINAVLPTETGITEVLFTTFVVT